MDYVLAIALVVHIVTAVFWAGTSMVQARIGNDHAIELFRPQMGSAGLAVVAGAVLWFGHHADRFGPEEQILAAAIFAALVALLSQILAFRALVRGESAGLAGLAARRAIAALMGLAVLGMALSGVF